MIQIQNLISTKNKETPDVVNYKYVLDCIEHQLLLPLSSKYLLHASEKTKLLLKKTEDIFGMSDVEPVTEVTVKLAFEKFRSMNVLHTKNADKSMEAYLSRIRLDLRRENLNISDCLNWFDRFDQEELSLLRRFMFHQCVFYFDIYETLHWYIDLTIDIIITY